MAGRPLLQRGAAAAFDAGVSLVKAFGVAVRRRRAPYPVRACAAEGNGRAVRREPARAEKSALLAKLAEALFIETLRCYMAELPRQRTGWLAAARDSAVGRALGALHREPTRAWTVASLAQQAGVSRTVFAERFTRLLGEAPLAYVARCRMQLGARLLETTDDSVLQVALNSGYESEAAFNRASSASSSSRPRAIGVNGARETQHPRARSGGQR